MPPRRNAWTHLQAVQFDYERAPKMRQVRQCSPLLAAGELVRVGISGVEVDATTVDLYEQVSHRGKITTRDRRLFLLFRRVVERHDSEAGRAVPLIHRLELRLQILARHQLGVIRPQPSDEREVDALDADQNVARLLRVLDDVELR